MVKPWDTATIGDFLDFKNGLNKGKEFFGYGTPIVNYTDVYRKRGLTKSDVRGEVNLTRDEIHRFDARKNDVFFTRTSETPEEVGMSSVLLDDIDDCVFSGFVLRGRPKNDMFVPEYCKYCFTTEAIRSAIIMGCTYTTRALTNGTQLSAIEIVVPPKPEQEAIAKSLTEIDDLISSLEKLMTKKKAIKQGAMQELLTGKRRLPGFFGEWVNTKIGSITEVYSGGTPNTSEPAFWGGKIPWMNSGELNLKIVRQVQGRITEVGMDSSSTHFIPAECVLIGLAGQGKTRGTAAFNTFPLCTNQSIAAIYPNPNKFDSKFLYYKMDTQYDQLRELSSGDGGRGGLNKKLILDYEVVIPQSIDEQAAIATILTEMDYEIENLEMKLTKYRQVKQGMMQQLLTGKIRLKNDVEDLRQAEQANAVKTLPARTAHNRQFDDAVSIAAIVDVFYSDKYPLGRVKVQKLLYLLHRHQAVSVSDFKKKAAGPYADTVRYKGGEPIAKKNKYIVSENGKQGTRYSRGENMAQALNYVERWGMQSDLQWLKENFLHTGRNDLELFATVDMAICDLNEAGVPISVASIKDLIASSKEWKAKLSKTYFSDRDIARAIKKCTELFN